MFKTTSYFPKNMIFLFVFLKKGVVDSHLDPNRTLKSKPPRLNEHVNVTIIVKGRVWADFERKGAVRTPSTGVGHKKSVDKLMCI